MPRSFFNYPPPTRPLDDADSIELRNIAILCKEYPVAKDTNQGDPSQTYLKCTDKVSKILGRLTSKYQNKAWTLYDSHSIDAIETLVEGDLVYFKGDIVHILEAQGRWILGHCRGRIGITCLDYLEYDEFVRALADYTPTNDNQISLRKGQVLPAIASSHKGWLLAFKENEEGLIPSNYIEPERIPFSQRYGPDCYQYTPLEDGHIRLICFSDEDNRSTQACGIDTIFFSLVSARLDIAPAFTALSYCWGNANRLETVFCDGKPLRITQNLAALLRWFAKDKSETDAATATNSNALEARSKVYLWADAICINQSNSTEKSCQIPLMGTIYGTAQHVRVYLGEGDNVNDVLFSFALIYQNIPESSYFVSWPDAEVREILAKIDLAALLKFFSNQAFHRSWMIQEMVLGNDVTLWYGHMQLSLRAINNYIQFQDATNLSLTNTKDVDLTSAQQQDVQLGIYHADNLTKVKYKWGLGEPLSFIEVLRRFRGAKATDLRDKVYSLLSLAGDHYSSSIFPSYSESITVADVFIKVANLAVTSPRKEDIAMLLDSAGLHTAESIVGHTLPSWVPDWTVLSCSPIDPNFYNCTSSTSLSVHVANNTTACREIIVKGAIIDKIAFLGPVWLNNELDQPLPQFPSTRGIFMASVAVHEMLYWISQKMIEENKQYPSSETNYQEAIWQTLTCGRGWGQRRANIDDRRYYNAFRKKLGIEMPVASQDGEVQSETEDDHPFMLPLLQAQIGRRVGVTRKRYFGTFPNQTIEGDVVALLFGLKTPFILRPQASNGEGRIKYQLVGQCYVHGIMDGELIVSELKDNNTSTISIKGGGEIGDVVLI